MYLYGVRIVSLVMEGNERLCLAQISNTLLKEISRAILQYEQSQIQCHFAL